MSRTAICSGTVRVKVDSAGVGDGGVDESEDDGSSVVDGAEAAGVFSSALNSASTRFTRYSCTNESTTATTTETSKTAAEMGMRSSMSMLSETRRGA